MPAKNDLGERLDRDTKEVFAVKAKALIKMSARCLLDLIPVHREQAHRSKLL
jgi:hypothetical protein